MKRKIMSAILVIAIISGVVGLVACADYDELGKAWNINGDTVEESTDTEITPLAGGSASPKITPFAEEYSGKDSDILGVNTLNNINVANSEETEPTSDSDKGSAEGHQQAQIEETSEEDEISEEEAQRISEAVDAAVAEIQNDLNTLQADYDQLVDERDALEEEYDRYKLNIVKKFSTYREIRDKNTKLEQLVEELMDTNAKLHLQMESGFVVMDGKGYCRYEYAMKRTIGNLSDGTSFHHARADVTDVVLYDDIIIGGSEKVYLDPTVAMARKDWQVAISFDSGNTIYSASVGNYNWAANGAFQGGKLSTGYKLVETDKRGSFGEQDTIAQVVIGVVKNAESELGVDFYFKAGLYNANPVPQPKPQQPQQPHVCPEPEKVVETIVETVVEKETVIVEVEVHCKDCGHKEGPCPDSCNCDCCPEAEIVIQKVPVIITITEESKDPDDEEETTDDTWEPDDETTDDTWNPDDETTDDTWNPDDETTDDNNDDWNAEEDCGNVDDTWNSDKVTDDTNNDSWKSEDSNESNNDNWNSEEDCGNVDDTWEPDKVTADGNDSWNSEEANSDDWNSNDTSCNTTDTWNSSNDSEWNVTEESDDGWLCD